VRVSERERERERETERERELAGREGAGRDIPTETVRKSMNVCLSETVPFDRYLFLYLRRVRPVSLGGLEIWMDIQITVSKE
jgi:hypothetical protein